MTLTAIFVRSLRYSAFGATAVLLLSGCENLPESLKPGPLDGEAATPSGTLTLEERDVEAPDVFNVVDDAIWDGRPSFGGVWVAYPGNTQPERVNIRNVENGKSVVGALFKREADNPGPKITLSSDAAEAIGVVAGTPTKLTITALRREPVEVAGPAQPTPATEVLSTAVLDPIEEQTDVSAAPSTEALSTIEEAVNEVASDAGPAVPAPTPATTGPAPKKPFIQVGTFSSEGNAKDLVSKLNSADVPATQRTSTSSSGKTLYRVVAGPAASAEEFDLFLSKISGLGFKDAFGISN